MGKKRKYPLFSRVKRAFSAFNSAPQSRSQIIQRFLTQYSQQRASYDAAATTSHNKKHWGNTNAYDADSALYGERTTIRERINHEMRNNTYAKGLPKTFSDYILGKTGPRLQIQTGDPELNKRTERSFNRWALQCEFKHDRSLRDLLSSSIVSLFPNGEFFWVPKTAKTIKNKHLSRVTLRFMELEADRVQTPFSGNNLKTNNIHDGIELDDDGRVSHVWISKKHPGDNMTGMLGSEEFDREPYESVVHGFVVDRAERTRGEAWMAASLEVFANRRRWTESTLRAGEMAAIMAAFLSTTSDAIVGDDNPGEDPDEIDINPGTMTVLPPGYSMQQMNPQHPSQSYKEFNHELLASAGREKGAPYNVVAADSSDHNYSSGRLDWQGFLRSIETIRAWLGERVCNYIFYSWLQEAVLVGEVPLKMLKYDFDWNWFFPGVIHIDPKREAEGFKIRMENGGETLQRYWAEEGEDWREKVDEMAEAAKYAAEKGITIGEGVQLIGAKDGEENDETDPEDKEADEADEVDRALDAAGPDGSGADLGVA